MNETNLGLKRWDECDIFEKLERLRCKLLEETIPCHDEHPLGPPSTMEPPRTQEQTRKWHKNSLLD